MRDAVTLACAEANKSVETFKLGAVLLHGRTVVASGRNHNNNPCGLHSVHAEMDALWKAGGWRTRGLHMVVVRILRDGRWACSRPCAACERAMARLGIAKVTYTTGDPIHPLATLTPQRPR
jgi:tRNA(Arg) A34 adenosine deaminase TadA